MYLSFFISYIFAISFISSEICPFPSCSSKYEPSIGSCTINCDFQKFPSKGQNFSSSTKIDINFKRTESIPKNAFEGLLIRTLKIDATNLKLVDNEAFSNIKNLDSFYLTNLADLSIIFKNDKIKYLSTMTGTFSVTNSNLDETNSLVLLNNLKNWTKLESLIFDKNLFKTFSFDFKGFFPSLISLSLSHNSIKSFDINSSNLSSLNLDNNQIENLAANTFINLPSLKILRLNSNKISNIYNETFSSVKMIFELNLENNTINYIESDSFCKLSKMSRLYLSNNNLRSVRLNCLETVSYLHLSNVQFEGEIDQSRIGSPNRVFKLFLSQNKISKISLLNLTSLRHLDLSSNNLNHLTVQTIRAFPNLVELNIVNNKLDNKILENLYILKSLRDLYLSNNFLSEIRPNYLNESKELITVSFDNNQIENVEFPSLKRLVSLDLRNNKLRQIKKETFSKLNILEFLYLDANLISKIHSKSFDFNQLAQLSLSDNYLTTVPHLFKLSFLQSLNLKNNKITFLPNYALQRMEYSVISIDLSGNNITSYSSKAFCSQYDTGLNVGSHGIELIIDDINQMDKCFLNQFSSSKNKIVSAVKPSCEHLFMATHKKIQLNTDASVCVNTSTNFSYQNLIVNECITSTKYKCPQIYKRARYTTWITGDPHLYSYKNRYELCSTGQDAVCFEYGDFQLLCSDSHAGGSNKQATVLTGLKFVYQLESSAKVSFVANNVSFADKFDNGQAVIYDKNMEKLAEIIEKGPNTRVIVIAKTNTHIFVSKWNSFYSIALRTTHETYSKSSGYLFEGCRLQDQLDARNNRQTFNKINAECNAECSAIEFSAEDENFPKDLIHDLCLFDCNEIGKNSTAMIKSMARNIKKYILTDSIDESIETTKKIVTTSSVSKLSTTKNNANTSFISNLNKLVYLFMILKASF